MKIEAASRLTADIDQQLKNKQSQIDGLQQRLPSKTNRMDVSPDQQGQIRKRINDLRNQIIDLREKKRNALPKE